MSDRKTGAGSYAWTGSEEGPEAPLGDVQAALRAAGERLKNLPIHEVGTGGAPFMVLDGDMQVVNLEAFLESPLRAKAHVKPHDLASLIAYVKRYGDPARTVVFANEECGVIQAVLDYHAPQGVPGHGEHRATLALRLTPEWQAWRKLNGVWVDQAVFAEFLQDRLPEIVEPEAALILETAQLLDVSRNLEFKSAISIQTGAVKLVYEEAIDGRVRGGQQQVPTAFVLGLAPWIGCALYRVKARLRYRLSSQKLQFRVDLAAPERVTREAFGALLDQLREATGFPVFRADVP